MDDLPEFVRAGGQRSGVAMFSGAFRALCFCFTATLAGCGGDSTGSPSPRSPAATTRPAMENQRISLEYYDKIRDGMTLQEVVDLLGPFSETIAVQDSAATEGHWFLWQRTTTNPRKTIQVRIKEGKVSAKSSNLAELPRP